MRNLDKDNTCPHCSVSTVYNACPKCGNDTLCDTHGCYVGCSLRKIETPDETIWKVLDNKIQTVLL